jgi:hypothetical protein
VGVVVGDEALDGLTALREKFEAREPVSFVADIATATEVQEVLIADLQVREVAGKPNHLAYRLTIKEYIPPPPGEEAAARAVDEAAQGEASDGAEEQTDDVSNDLAILEVRVELPEGEDHSGVAVEVEGTTDDGESFALRIEEQTDGLYRAEDIRNGTYTVRAVPR